MHLRHRQAVAGDADEADETLVASLDRGFERAALAQRGLPLDHVDEVVQLEQVDAIDAEPVERAANLLARAGAVALPGLRREEEPVAVPAQPRSEPQLRVAVRRCRVDVIDAVLEQELERGIGLGLTERAERRSAEDRARALVSGAPERRLGDHPCRLTCADVPHDLIAVGDVMLDGTLPAPVAGTSRARPHRLRRGRVRRRTRPARRRVSTRVQRSSAGWAQTPPAGWWQTRLPRTASRRCWRSTPTRRPAASSSWAARRSSPIPGASARLAPDDLPATLEAGAVLVSGYTLLQRGSEPAARAAIERARTAWLAVDAGSARSRHGVRCRSIPGGDVDGRACCWRTPTRPAP